MFYSMFLIVCLLSDYLSNSLTIDLDRRFGSPRPANPGESFLIVTLCKLFCGVPISDIMYKLLYPSIMVRTVPPVSVRVRNRVSVSFSFTICALKLIFKLISGKECIDDCAPSFELVHRRKYSVLAIVTANLAVKIARRIFLRQQSL